MSRNHIRKLYELRNNFKYAFAYQFLAYPYEFHEINKKQRVLDYLKFFWSEFVKNEKLSPDTYTTSFEHILSSRQDYYDLYYSSYDSIDELMLFIKMPDILDINEPDAKYSWHNSVGVGYILYYNKKENTARFYVCESSMNSSMDIARLNGQYVPVYFVVEIINGSRRNLGTLSSNSLEEIDKKFYSFVLYDLKNSRTNADNSDESDEDEKNNLYYSYGFKNKVDSHWEELDLLEKIKIALSYDKDDKQYKNVKKTYKEFILQFLQSLIRGMSLTDFYKWACHSEEKYSGYYFDRDYSLFIDSIDFFKSKLQDESFNKIAEGFKKEISFDRLIDNICDFAKYWSIVFHPNNFNDRTKIYNYNHTKDSFLNDKIAGETQNLISKLSEDNRFSSKNKFEVCYKELFGVLFEDYIIANVNNDKDKTEQIRKFIGSLSYKNQLSFIEQKKIIYSIRDYYEIDSYDNIIDKNIDYVIDGVSSILSDETKNISDSSVFDNIRNKFVYLVENLEQRKDNNRSELDTALYKCRTIKDIVETMKPVVPLIPVDLQPKLANVLDQLSKR